MDPKTGAIAVFETEKDAQRAGYTVPLTEAEAATLRPMNRKQRRAWLAEQRRAGKKPRNAR